MPQMDRLFKFDIVPYTYIPCPMCIILPDQVLLDKFTGSVHYHQKLCSRSDFLKSNLLSVKKLFRGNFHSSVKSDAIHYCVSAEGTSGFTLTLPDPSLSTLIASFAVSTGDKHRILAICETNHAEVAIIIRPIVLPRWIMMLLL